MSKFRLMWGSLLLAFGIGIAVFGIIDLGCLLLFGSASTLSQHLADSIHQSAGVLLVTNGLSFVSGMLATHFTGFRMQSGADELRMIRAALILNLGEPQPRFGHHLTEKPSTLEMVTALIEAHDKRVVGTVTN